MSFRDIKPGEEVVRMLGGMVKMTLLVDHVDDNFIYVGFEKGGWKFCRDTGAEVDEELGWGPQFGVTGSFLVKPEEKA